MMLQVATRLMRLFPSAQQPESASNQPLAEPAKWRKTRRTYLPIRHTPSSHRIFQQAPVYDACAAVTQWAFADYGFVRIQGIVLATNARSARVLQKCGFRYEGLLRAYRMVRGTPGDFAMYARVATD